MTEADDPNRADRKNTQPANASDSRQDATQDTAAAPRDDRKPAEKDGAQKPEFQTPARENLERVGVDAEHKTEAMRKHQRGTFP